MYIFFKFIKVVLMYVFVGKLLSKGFRLMGFFECKLIITDTLKRRDFYFPYNFIKTYRKTKDWKFLEKFKSRIGLD